MANPGAASSAKVIDIRTGRAVITNLKEYNDLLDGIEQLLKEIPREDKRGINLSLVLLKEFRWNAAYNKDFRDQTVVFLQDTMDGLYEQVNR